MMEIKYHHFIAHNKLMDQKEITRHTLLQNNLGLGGRGALWSVIYKWN